MTIKPLIRNLFDLAHLRGVYNYAAEIKRPFSVFWRVMRCRRNYAAVLSRIWRKPKGVKIRVLFINSEPVKWKCQKLYEELRDSGIFDVMVGLSAWNSQSDIDDDALDKHLVNAERYFDELGVRHVRTVKTHPRISSDLSEFNPDIVIYNEQWRPCLNQRPEVVSRFALTFFIPYYVPDYGNVDIDCKQPVERFAYGYFTLNEEWSKLYNPYFKWYNSTPKLLPMGHPALDFFSRQDDRKPKRDYIIYAPHFSIPETKGKRRWYITQSTFDWSGKWLLDYAKRHPEQHWVFKPHPLLRAEMLNIGYMTEDELDAYYAEWEKIGTACYTGDYQDIFLESRVMLTDCGSFLAEYGSTSRPLIHLWCKQNKTQAPRPSKMLWGAYYHVEDEKDLDAVLKSVVERREDPKREERLAMIKGLQLNGHDASKTILEYFKRLLRR